MEKLPFPKGTVLVWQFQILTNDGEIGIILELKYAEDGKLDAACREALEQIEQRRYEEALLDEGVDYILKYGIAFYKKRCRVMFATDAD